MEVDWQSKNRGPEALQINRDHEGLQLAESPSRAAPWYKGDGWPGDGRGQRILGLSVKAFWIVVVVLVLIIAGGVGGGVGGGLAAQKKANTKASETSSSSQPSAPPQTQPQTTPSPTSTPPTTPPSTTSSSTPGGPSPIIRTPCSDDPSSSNNTLISAHDTNGGSPISAFTLLCNTNYPAGTVNPGIIDLLRIWVPDMNACVDQCAEYNLGYAVAQNQSPKCVAVAVVRNTAEYCYLKSATGKNDTSTSGGAPIDTAVLINA